MSLGIPTLSMADRHSAFQLFTKCSSRQKSLNIVKIWNGLTRFQTPCYDQQQDQLAGGRQCGRLHNIGSHLMITALMSSRTSCQKSDKIRQKSAPMSSGPSCQKSAPMSSRSSCQKSDKDQPPCPQGLVVKNQTLKVRPWNSKQRIWRCQQRGILLKSPQQGLFDLKIHRNLPHY